MLHIGLVFKESPITPAGDMRMKTIKAIIKKAAQGEKLAKAEIKIIIQDLRRRRKKLERQEARSAGSSAR